LGFTVVALVVTLGLAGCGGSKDFSPEDFKKISKDMSEAKVLEILGSPKETVEALGTRRLFWEARDKYYSISFKDGKVVEPMAHGSKQDYEMMKELMKAAKNFPNKP
jgi:hypothetical protein